MALDSGYFEVRNPIKTNADRIRSMSDEELAVAIGEYAYTGACNDFGITVNVKCCGNCTKCTGIIDWLKQPVEVIEVSAIIVGK